VPRLYLVELQEMGYQGSYETVKRYIRSLREKAHREATVRFETPPGKQSQVDFSYIGRVRGSVDRLRKAWVFCRGLSHSKIDYYEAVQSQKVEKFLRSQLHAFHYFGGVPRIIKIDNFKSAALRAHFYEAYGYRVIKNILEKRFHL